MKFLMLVCVEEDSFENDETAEEAAAAGETAAPARGGYRGQRELSLAR